MDTWAFQTGQIDADGNYIDKTSAKEDKYWHKYMSEASPYREKFSPPTMAKSPEQGKTRKRMRGKKKPRWMTNEEYERLMIKSYAKKPAPGEETNKGDGYFDNGGEILRWPEILQQRAQSPGYKRAAQAHSPQRRDGDHVPAEDSNLQELDLVAGDPAKGTYRPNSAPLTKGVAKNLFQKKEPGTFFNDLLVGPPEYPLARNKGTGTAVNGRKSRETSPKHGRKLKLDDAYNAADVGTYADDDGIVEYGDTYVIENEEEAIHRIQAAMISAVAQAASPERQRRRNAEGKEAEGDEDAEMKIGAGLHVSGE